MSTLHTAKYEVQALSAMDWHVDGCLDSSAIRGLELGLEYTASARQPKFNPEEVS